MRVALLTDVVKPKKAFMHFITNAEGKKMGYRCLSKRGPKNVMIEQADCCKKLNHDDNQKAQLSITVLAAKYTNADPKTGKYEKADTPLRFEIGFLKLSPSGFKQIAELVQEDETERDFDFTMAYRENKIGYEYKRVSKAARFRQNPQVLAEVLKDAAKFADGAILTKRLGKVVTALDMKAVLAGGGSTASKGAQIDNTDDL